MATIADINSRTDLAEILVSRLNAAVWALFGITSLKNNIQTEYELPVPGRILSFRLFYDAIAEKGGQQSLNQVQKNAFIILHCNLARDISRITESYYYRTNQQDILKSQTWYMFSRIIANSLSHNYRFEFHREEIRLSLPVTYREITITIDDENKPVNFNTDYLYLLVEDIIEFVRKNKALT